MSRDPDVPADPETIGRRPIEDEPGGPTRADRSESMDRTIPAPTGETGPGPTTAAGPASPHSPTDGPRRPGAPAGPETSSPPSGNAEATEPLGASETWGRRPPPVFEPGRVVFEKFRLVEKIGIGGMGEVWKVQNVELDRTSALKLIKPEIAQNDNGWIRFQREARLMAKLHHPGAVAVHDFRRTHSMGYIEMEFIRGRSLDQVLKEEPGQPFPIDRVRRILDQLCAVLHEAHGHRDEETGKHKPIIHRDLKPSNLMLVERGRDDGEVQLKVLDFGIAKMIEDDGGDDVTGAHDIVGTPAYMSPEQIRGGLGGEDEPLDIDARSDLYSAGVVLYHLLTGTLPFAGNKMTLLASHLSGKPREMQEANPNHAIPPAVERVVMQCLEKDPARRPQSALELAEAFRRAAGVEAGRAPAPPSAGRPLPAIAAAAAVLVLVAGGLIVLLGRTRSPSSPSGPVAATPGPDASAGPAPTTSDPEAVAAPAPPKAREADRATIAKPAWMPPGFSAASATVDTASGLAEKIRRDDGAMFRLAEGRIYLPEGYRAEDPGAKTGRWPPAIVRQSGGARFVRIEGGVFLRGDPRPGAQPASDVWGNPLTKHHVRVGGFYIQDREVTNGEIDEYLKNHPEAEPEFAQWRRWYAEFQEQFQPDASRASRYPAVSIPYRSALRYAASVGGLLPTEAQWEFAAKSRTDDRLFSWGQEFPKGTSRPANLDNIQGTPAEARTFDKDKTAQDVYDMTGNVRELCADAYEPYDKLPLADISREHPLVDRRPTAMPDSVGTRIVVRGGSFLDRPQKALSFMRDRLGVEDFSNYIGFRVVIECPSRDEDAGGR